ncbi:targeting protein for Xklp2-B-like isoform X2 [Ambystoma mexicanum]|uniref:targeting protein for Xklp2-B-like isoform X2 n=1 Tax=Ambystoma mexicanum TaxID=8296 RepID=UPI0037E7C00B
MDVENLPPQQDDVQRHPNRTPASKANLPLAVIAPFTFDEGVVEQFDNMATSLGSLHAELRSVSDADASAGGESDTLPRRASRRLSLPQKRRQLAKIREGRRSMNIAHAPGEIFMPTIEGHLPMTPTTRHPPNKKLKLFIKGNVQKPEFRLHQLQRTLGMETSLEGTPNKSHGEDCSSLSAKPTSRTPISVVPMVLMRKRTEVKTKSTEEQELETMQKMQKEVAQQRRRNERNLRASIAGTGQPVRKTVGPVTQPVDFRFSTDDHLKRSRESKPADCFKEVDFAAVLRKPTSSPARLPKGGRTIPKPFKLSKGNKRKHEEDAEPCKFVSTTEQVEAFFKRTPCRYHLRSRLQQNAGQSPVKIVKAKRATPKTPTLMTKCRHRPVTFKSTAEPESEKLEKQQHYTFRARALDRRVLDGSLIPPKKHSMKETTKVAWEAKRGEQEEEKFTFHSRPCPSKMLEGVVGVPEKKSLACTVPKSPAFVLKNRVRELAHTEEQEETPPIRANPMPLYGVPFKPKIQEPHHVQPVPFSFDSRDKERFAQKEKKLEELRRGEAPTFKAMLLPYFDHVSLPEKKVKAPTCPEPFHLQIEERAAKKTQQWKQKLEEELRQQKEASCFKARPNVVIHQEPFVPKRDNRTLTESLCGSIVQESFELATEKRAKERKEFEKQLEMLEAMKTMMDEEERRTKEEQEKEELAQRRQQLVHKAQPVMKYKTVAVKTSAVPRTVPKSPIFSDRFNC